MKKSIFLLMILPFLFNCSNDDILIRNAEKFLLTQLNDPDSYKRESFVITEIVRNDDVPIKSNERVLQSLEGLIDIINQTLIYENSLKEKDAETEKDILKCRREIDSLNIIKISYLTKIDSLKQIKNNKSNIFCIYFLATYRAKNSFGEYAKEVTKIRYFYYSNTFEIPSENKFVGY